MSAICEWNCHQHHVHMEHWHMAASFHAGLWNKGSWHHRIEVRLVQAEGDHKAVDLVKSCPFGLETSVTGSAKINESEREGNENGTHHLIACFICMMLDLSSVLELTIYMTECRIVPETLHKTTAFEHPGVSLRSRRVRTCYDNMAWHLGIQIKSDDKYLSEHLRDQTLVESKLNSECCHGNAMHKCGWAQQRKVFIVCWEVMATVAVQPMWYQKMNGCPPCQVHDPWPKEIMFIWIIYTRGSYPSSRLKFMRGVFRICDRENGLTRMRHPGGKCWFSKSMLIYGKIIHGKSPITKTVYISTIYINIFLILAS